MPDELGQSASADADSYRIANARPIGAAAVLNGQRQYVQSAGASEHVQLSALTRERFQFKIYFSENRNLEGKRRRDG
jgi:hypothetical protein